MSPPKPSEASREELLLDAMRLATVAFKGWVGEVLMDRPISMGQFWTLSDIADLGPISAAQLATYRCVKPPTVSVLVDELVNDGLIVRSGSKSDRRVVELSLTPRGREVVTATWRHIGARLAEATRELPARDIESTIRVLTQLDSRARLAAATGGAA